MSCVYYYVTCITLTYPTSETWSASGDPLCQHLNWSDMAQPLVGWGFSTLHQSSAASVNVYLEKMRDVKTYCSNCSVILFLSCRTCDVDFAIVISRSSIILQNMRHGVKRWVYDNRGYFAAVQTTLVLLTISCIYSIYNRTCAFLLQMMQCKGCGRKFASRSGLAHHETRCTKVCAHYTDK